ncbi:MAG: hypothetical protein R3F55_17825 [Alphaproteobacteria bacterium]
MVNRPRPDDAPRRRREPVFNTEGKLFSLLFAAACVAVFVYRDLRPTEQAQFIPPSA